MKKFSAAVSPSLTCLALVFLLVVGFSSCKSISIFNETAYEQATSLKVEALLLMGKATEPFDSHLKDVESLAASVEKAYEFAKGRPKNEISAKQWEILKDPERNLLGGFLKRWKEESTLSRAFVNEAKLLIGDAFDTIIGLESGKIKPRDVK